MGSIKGAKLATLGANLPASFFSQPTAFGHSSCTVSFSEMFKIILFCSSPANDSRKHTICISLSTPIFFSNTSRFLNGHPALDGRLLGSMNAIVC